MSSLSKLLESVMSDLEIILEEIASIQSAISDAIYICKSQGRLKSLERIADELNTALDHICMLALGKIREI